MRRVLQASIVVYALLLSAVPALGADVRHEIQYPDLPGYKTLACDFHMHTVFSDGNVWPPVRVAEAWRQGLHAIAISDHVEYQPHKDDVPTNHERPFQLAEGPAKAHNLLLAKAAEITRDTPPGHFNAIFLKDVKPLDTKDFLEAIQRANEQGAFVFWNHQGWQGPEKGRWMDVHTTMYEKKWFQGMEVCNGDEYYPDAHKWCLDKKLTMLGNTDIHDPDLRSKSTTGDHRTMTLVFAKEKTLPAVKESLHEGRTVVWYKDQLIGREELLRPFFHACVEVAKPHLRTKNMVLVEVRNVCQADIHLKRTGNVGPVEIALPARTTSLVKISVTDPKKPVELKYTAANFLTAPGTGMPVILSVPGP
jgi:hypothetical protein